MRTCNSERAQQSYYECQTTICGHVWHKYCQFKVYEQVECKDFEFSSVGHSVGLHCTGQH